MKTEQEDNIRDLLKASNEGNATLCIMALEKMGVNKPTMFFNTMLADVVRENEQRVKVLEEGDIEKQELANQLEEVEDELKWINKRLKEVFRGKKAPREVLNDLLDLEAEI